MDTMSQLEETQQRESAEEWRTLRCLLRKKLKVPRQDVCRLKMIGIDSIEALLQVHYTMVPNLWRRLKTRGGAYVHQVALFCFWYQRPFRLGLCWGGPPIARLDCTPRTSSPGG